MKLLVNNRKTTFLQFHSKRSQLDSSPLIKLGGRSIKECTETKFLGLTINNTLDWAPHIELVAKKLASAAYLLRNLQPLTSEEILKTAYYALFQSHIAYGIILWGHSSHIKRLFVLQKRALRNMAGASRNPCAEYYFKDSCRPLFKKYKILTLPSLYILNCIRYVVENRSVILAKDFLHGYNTRNKHYPNVQKHKTTQFTNGPIYVGTKLFNALPTSFKKNTNCNFHLILKKILIDKCFYSLEEFYKKVHDE